MIKRKTVFVFGAGLSSDYGFPTSSQLRDEVINLLIHNVNNSQLSVPIEILRKIGYEPIEIQQVRNQLARGGFDTIDEFLEKRKNNVRYRLLAKTAVAMATMQHEYPHFFEKRSSTTDFYWFLFNKMAKDAEKATFADNKVTILTYNYDRSFEQFLSTTLEHHYDMMPQEVDAIMSKIKIIHIHGMLGKMRWQAPTHMIYGNKFNETTVRLASEGIVNFDDENKTKLGYEEAHEALKEAESLVFVGFGFHALNLSRLIGKSLIHGNLIDNLYRVTGTAYKISKTKMKEIDKITHGKLNENNLIDKKAALFAQEHLDWLE